MAGLVWCGFIPNLANQSLTCLSTLAVSLPVKVLTFITSPSYLASRRARLQALVENAGRDLVYSFWFEGRTTLGRNVDVSDWDGLALHHDEPRNSQPNPRLPP